MLAVRWLSAGWAVRDYFGETAQENSSDACVDRALEPAAS